MIEISVLSPLWGEGQGEGQGINQEDRSMISKRLKEVLTPSRDPFGPAPQQMTLFPDEQPGVNLERMKIKTLLRAFYKSADDSLTVGQAG